MINLPLPLFVLVIYVMFMLTAYWVGIDAAVYEHRIAWNKKVKDKYKLITREHYAIYTLVSRLIYILILLWLTSSVFIENVFSAAFMLISIIIGYIAMLDIAYCDKLDKLQPGKFPDRMNAFLEGHVFTFNTRPDSRLALLILSTVTIIITILLLVI